MVFNRLVRAALAVMLPLAAQAQQASDSTRGPSSAGTADNGPPLSTPASARSLPLPFRGGPLVTGYNVWAGSAMLLQMASNNERINGASLGMVGFQFSRALFVMRGVQVSWLVEVLPAVVATVGAPENRIPSLFDRERLARYELHDTYGFGIAPLGLEVSRRIAPRVSATFTTTAGGALFSSVIPYGKATQANFTVAPSLGLEVDVGRGYALSSGYMLHHLSNASFGDANPGLNSHIVFVRLSKTRFR